MRRIRQKLLKFAKIAEFTENQKVSAVFEIGKTYLPWHFPGNNQVVGSFETLNFQKKD